MRHQDKEYKEKLISFNYTEEEANSAIEFRSKLEHMTFEQFTFLFQQGIVARTVKLRKPRNLYVGIDGRIWYLNQFYKNYESVGFFKEEENE